MTTLDQLVGILKDGRRLLTKDISALRVSDTCAKQLPAACVLCRIATNLKAIDKLYNENMVLEANTILRSCMESVFWLGAISRQPGFVDKIIKDDDARRRNLAKNVLKIPDTLLELTQSDKEALIERRDRKIADPDPLGVTVRSAAAASGLDDLYSIYLTVSNESAHPSAASLNRHLILNQAQEIIGINLEPVSQEWELSMSLACDLLFYTKIYANEIFTDGATDWQENLWQQYLQTTARINFNEIEQPTATE